MKQKELFGKYAKLTRKTFSHEDLENINTDILNGVNIIKIAEKYHVGYHVIHSIFVEFILNSDSRGSRRVQAIFGYKKQEYYTEEELLAGIDFSSYTWENLTEHEKQFYLNYGTEKHNGNDSSLEQDI